MRYKPYKIKLGPYTFAVRWTDVGEDTDWHGVTDFILRHIRLRRSGDSKVVAHTKIHEYLHAIEYTFGMSMSEQDVDTIAAGLTQILLGRGIDPWDL